MLKKISDLIRVFFTGIGLKIALSYVPPVLAAWTFFLLLLRSVLSASPDEFRLTVVSGLAGIFAGSVVVVWLILSLVPPLRRIIEMTMLLEKGDTSIDIPYQRRKDEIGELARALHIFKRTAIEKADLQKKQDEAKRRAEEDRRRASREMGEEFLGGLASIVPGLRGAVAKEDTRAAPPRTGVPSWWGVLTPTPVPAAIAST